LPRPLDNLQLLFWHQRRKKPRLELLQRNSSD
jgi:hypothetical protein